MLLTESFSRPWIKSESERSEVDSGTPQTQRDPPCWVLSRNMPSAIWQSKIETHVFKHPEAFLRIYHTTVEIYHEKVIGTWYKSSQPSDKFSRLLRFHLRALLFQTSASQSHSSHHMLPQQLSITPGRCPRCWIWMQIAQIHSYHPLCLLYQRHLYGLVVPTFSFHCLMSRLTCDSRVSTWRRVAATVKSLITSLP